MMDDALVKVKWEPFKRKILDKYFQICLQQDMEKNFQSFFGEP